MAIIPVMDLLADVLSVAGVRGTVAARVEASEPWGLELARVPGAAFHAMTTGTAWLQVLDTSPIHLMPGDLVLLASGAPHRLSSDQGGPVVPFDHVAAEQSQASGGLIRIGNGCAQVRILCASYRQDATLTTPLLELFPQVVHIRAGSGEPSLADTLRLLGNELQQPDMGTSAVLDRLVDVLLIQVLRTWSREHPEQLTASWLRGLRDPATAAALASVHADPARAWSVEALAETASVSRATLVRRFVALVGETPNAYLTRWRMDLAARLLRDSDDPVHAVARAVGYTSEYAFSRAFSRSRADPPGRYRQLAREGAAGKADRGRSAAQREVEPLTST
jgi:AraC-like DNA-binding protein